MSAERIRIGVKVNDMNSWRECLLEEVPRPPRSRSYVDKSISMCSNMSEHQGRIAKAEFLVVADAQEFIAARDSLPPSLSAFLTTYSIEEYAASGAELHLHEFGKAGYAIKPDGDVVSVFSAPGAHLGDDIVEDAIRNGADRCDCIGTFLRDLYGRHGFKVFKTEPWNDRYRPKNWDEAKFGTPDVYHMELPKVPPNAGAMRRSSLRGSGDELESRLRSSFCAYGCTMFQRRECPRDCSEPMEIDHCSDRALAAVGVA
jgi:hypothetical protein